MAIDPTADEQQDIFEELLRDNHIRKNAQMPLYDGREEFAARLTMLRQAKYRKLLAPYLAGCLAELPVPSGLIQRLSTQASAERTAAKRLFVATGIKPEADALPSLVNRLVSSCISSDTPKEGFELA